MFEIIIDATFDLEEKYKRKTKIVPLYIIDREENKKIPITSDYSVFYENEELIKKWKEGKLGTSQPSVGDFVKAIEENKSDEVLIMTISSKLSGTYNAAVSASKKANKNVFVFDTLSGSIGAGLYAKKAIEMRKRGYSMEEVVNELNKLKAKAYLSVDNINYLFRSGRMNMIKYAFLKVTKLFPILTLKRGRIELEKLSKNPFEDLEKIESSLKEVVWGYTQRKPEIEKKKPILVTPLIAVNIGPAFGLAGFLA